MDSPAKDPLAFCFAFMCCPCANYVLRSEALEGDMTKYKCCQGYYDCMCFKAGACGDSGNVGCAACEMVCCMGPAVSSSRMLVMDTRDIIPDPCDNRIIRFSNCMQLLACVCQLLACFFEELREAAQIIDCIAGMWLRPRIAHVLTPCFYFQIWCSTARQLA
jgi:hypothetical protein